MLPRGRLPRSSMPLHHQLWDLLRSAITSGRVVKGTLLPSERELATQYGVSRITVRRALQTLAAEGYIQRQRPKGTIVISSRPQATAVWAIGSLDDVVAFGGDTRLMVRSYRLEPVTGEISSRLQLPPGDLVYCLRGIRLLDQQPLCQVRIYLPPTVGARLSRHDLVYPTVFAAIQDKLGIALREAQQTVSAERADEDFVRELGGKVGDPILHVERLYLSADQIPVELAITRFRGDRYRLSSRLTRLGEV